MDDQPPRTVLDDLAKLNQKFLWHLGSGTFGAVMEVESTEDGRRRALKRVRRASTNHDGEILLWSTLDHQNLLCVERIFTIRGPEHPRHFFLMPVLERTLEEALRKDGAFRRDHGAFGKARRWLEDVVRGVAHMHGQGLAHMDVKVDNVLLSADDAAKVADFTFVCPASRPSAKWGAPRTVAPPEACKSFDNPLVDPRPLDAWTVGMLALRMFIGKSPASMPNDSRPRDGQASGWWGLWTRITNLALQPSQEDSGDQMAAPEWVRDMYPRVKRALHPKEFARRLMSAYPASSPSCEDAVQARAFVGSLLHLNPEKREPLDRVLGHKLFGGSHESAPLDEAWSTPLDRDRHRRNVAELHDRLAGEDRKDLSGDERLWSYQGRVPWILMDAEGNVVSVREGFSEYTAPSEDPGRISLPEISARGEEAGSGRHGSDETVLNGSPLSAGLEAPEDPTPSEADGSLGGDITESGGADAEVRKSPDESIGESPPPESEDDGADDSVSDSRRDPPRFVLTRGVDVRETENEVCVATSSPDGAVSSLFFSAEVGGSKSETPFLADDSSEGVQTTAREGPVETC